MALAFCVFFLLSLAGVKGQAPGAACGTGGACTSPAMCDIDNTCKNAIGADCTAGATAYCPVNAKCQGTAGTGGGTSCECVVPFKARVGFCVPLAGFPCGAGQCLDNGVCTSGACECATGFAAGSAGDTSCSCPTGYTLQQGVCKKTIGQACSAVSECVSGDGVICSTNCACDTSKGFAAGSAGDTSCSCDTSIAQATVSNGICPLKVGETCSANSDCISSDGLICDVGGSGNCACDTSNNYAAGSAGDTTCSCDTNYALRADKVCGKKIGQTCTLASECIDHTACLDGDSTSTNKCWCDTSANFALGSAGDTSCSCASNYEARADGSCGKVIGQTCSASSECIDYAVCIDGDSSGTTKCWCDTTKNFALGSAADTSCSCDTSKAAASPVGGVCPLKVGQACSAASDCITTDGMICGDRAGATKCTCDTSKAFAAGTDGDSTCSCDTSIAASSPVSGVCPLKWGQSCTATSDCINTPGMACISGQCKCDTTKNFAAGAAGDSTCTCATNHHLRSDDTCGLVIDQACTLTGTLCIDNAVCDTVSSTCKCDVGNGYAAGSAGDTSCSCDTSTHVSTSVGCGKKVGGACTSTCTNYATCDATSGRCSCTYGTSAFVQSSFTCNGGATLVNSFGLLCAGILLALRML